jgi:ribosomal protein S27AE
MRKSKAEKLEARRFHPPGRFIYGVYHFLSHWLILRKYHPTITVKDNPNDCKGSCFLIWNHLGREDHAYMIEATYPKRFNILAGYNEFFRSHLQFPFHLINALPKKNWAMDPQGLKNMMSIIKQGGSICFSPEGMSSIYGTNQPIAIGTGHFLKHFGIPVYIMKLKGAYLTNTKVCLDSRVGKCEAEISLLFSPEDLKKLTNEEIDDQINLAFKNDDYEYAKEQHVKWKAHGRICDHLNDICYQCPRCGEDLVMEAHGNEIKCKRCGNGAKMNDFYQFEPFDDTCVIPESPSKWVKLERRKVIEEIRKDPNYSFSVKVKIGFLPKYHFVRHKATTEIMGEGLFTLDHQGLHFEGTKNGGRYAFDLSYEDVFSLVIVTDVSFFSLYVKAEFVDFYPETPCVGKLLLLTEEMHRLHVNSWKCFPWDEYLYENLPA